MQWARDTFEGAFSKNAENAAQYITDPTFIDRIIKLPGVQPLEILESVKVSTYMVVFDSIDMAIYTKIFLNISKGYFNR